MSPKEATWVKFQGKLAREPNWFILDLYWLKKLKNEIVGFLQEALTEEHRMSSKYGVPKISFPIGSAQKI